MTATEEQPLFPMDPVMKLQKGDVVTVSTMWGNEECTVVDVRYEDGFPMAHLATVSGDEISVSIARVKR